MMRLGAAAATGPDGRRVSLSGAARGEGRAMEGRTAQGRERRGGGRRAEAGCFFTMMGIEEEQRQRESL